MIANMDTEEIIMADISKNHEGVTLEKAMELYQGLLDRGFKEYKTDTTIFLYKPEGKQVRYHTVNAGNMKDLVENFDKFKATLTDYDIAYTPITNPKLEGLVKRYFKKCSKIIDGNAVCNLKEN
jgi:hypothetical protein